MMQKGKGYFNKFYLKQNSVFKLLFFCYRNYGGSVPPQGPPNTQGPGNGQDPYGRGPIPPPSGYQQSPRFSGPPQNSSPATVNQTQGGSVSTPGYPPGQQSQQEYYRQEPPAAVSVYVNIS